MDPGVQSKGFSRYGLLENLKYMFQCFETPEMGLRHFRLFHFDSVILIYNLYTFHCFETPDMGSRIFTFFVSVC